jgi:hypothetical protein
VRGTSGAGLGSAPLVFRTPPDHPPFENCRSGRLEWIGTTALSDMLGVDFHELAEDALYRNLDKLHEHRVTIETALADSDPFVLISAKNGGWSQTESRIFAPQE